MKLFWDPVFSFPDDILPGSNLLKLKDELNSEIFPFIDNMLGWPLYLSINKSIHKSTHWKLLPWKIFYPLPLVLHCVQNLPFHQIHLLYSVARFITCCLRNMGGKSYKSCILIEKMNGTKPDWFDALNFLCWQPSGNFTCMIRVLLSRFLSWMDLPDLLMKGKNVLEKLILSFLWNWVVLVLF